MKNLTACHTARNHSPELNHFHRNSEFGNLMNYFWNYFDNNSAENTHTAEWEPQLQIVESKDAVTVTAEIPGVDAENLDLQISSDGYLSISGEKNNMFEDTEKNSYFSEISYGSFKRTVPLPWDLDYEHASANYSHGILTVSIPKSQVEKQKFKKINISTAQN
ncbi:MAG: Hsp20/alpha crystallin family protein [Alphaproteobacteria bacterium]|nr:Hsp20/alpha crystallin family protein [Alphaproteobacteria bacterium]